MYWLDPFNYLVSGLLGELIWDLKIECNADELVSFAIPKGQTCGEYMADFLSSAAGYVVDPNSTDGCSYCKYTTGADYANALNWSKKSDSWRDVSFLELSTKPPSPYRVSNYWFPF